MTRPLALAAALTLAAGPALAAPGSLELCTVISQSAGQAMILRQSGIPMHEVITRLSDTLSGDNLGAAVALVEAAYEEPHYGTPAYQARAVSDFSDLAFRICRED